MMIDVKPSLTVVIPCYNRQDELARALDSLVAQTDGAFDVVVCDDGSTDDIPAVVARYADRLSVTCLSIDNSGGPARPRNLGVAHSKAEWISFLDSDDWWFPDRIAHVRAALNEAVDIVYHRLRKHACDGSADHGKPLPEMVGHDLNNADPLRTMILHGNPVATSGATVRRTVLVESGGFCDDRTLASVEDFDLWLRLAGSRKRFRYMPDVLGAYCTGGEHISHFSTQYEKQRELFARQLTTLPPSYVAIARDRFEYLLGSYAVRLGRPEAASHLRRVQYNAGWMTWTKARAKLLRLRR